MNYTLLNRQERPAILLVIFIYAIKGGFKGIPEDRRTSG